MAEKGIFTPEQEKMLAQKLDDAIKLKGALELIDGYVFKALITFVDDKFIDKVAIDIKTKLSELANAVIAEDVTLAEQIAADLVNMLIDIPGLDEEAEGLLFKGIIEIIVGALVQWIESKKAEPVKLKLNR